MPLPTQIQFHIIIYSFLSGILTGMMFDLYRIIRGNNVNKAIIIKEDILFSILAALIVFSFLLYTNYAFLSLYVYMFMLIALVLYIRFISKTIMKTELIVFQGVSRVSRIIFKYLIYPFKIIFFNITGKNN